MDHSLRQLLQLVLPGQVLEQFQVTDVRSDETQHVITLEEMNAPPMPPEEYRGRRIVSKGFLRAQEVQDINFFLFRITTFYA
jgi:hypothetical protein